MQPPRRRRVILLGVLLSAALLPAVAPSALSTPAQGNRYDDLIGKYGREIVAEPSSYRAFLDIIEILRIRDLASPGRVEGVMKKIAGKGKLHPQAAILVRNFKIAMLSSSGDFSGAEKEIRDSGILTDWLVIGPFDNQDLKGCEREMGPEMDLGKPFSLGLAYEGDERSVNWREAASGPLSGILDMDRFLYPDVKVCGYGGAYVKADRDMNVRFWGTSSGTFTFWVDGKKVIDDPVYRGFGPARHAADVHLKKGVHQVMAKVCIDTGSWQLTVQVTDTGGKPVRLRHGADQELAALYRPPKIPPKTEEFKTALKELEDLVKDEANAEAAGDYARFLLLTGSDDVKQKKAQDIAKRAAEASGKCRDYITIALTTDDENKAMGALGKCLKAEPGNGDAATLMLVHLREILNFTDYAGEVEHDRKKFPDDPMMAIFKAEVLEDAGMPLTAFKELEKIRERFGDLPAVLSRFVDLAPQAATKEQREKLLDELLAIKADSAPLRHDLIRRLVRDGKHEEAMEEIARLVKYFWPGESSIRLAVEQLVAMNEVKAAEKILNDETQRAAQNPQAWESLGVFYNMTGDAKLALACFHTVLELNPQNVQVRQYISNLMPEEKFEVPYIRDDAFLAGLDKKLKEKKKPGESDAWSTENIDVTILVDQEVDRVYENGTSARFVQRSLRVNSEQGAKLQRYQFIAYSPMRQDLKILRAAAVHPDGTVEDSTGQYTIPVVEEEYRLYYDDANEVIEMPSLKPGDIVDLQYKLSDEEARNMWERHFGTMVALQSVYPKLFFLFEIIADNSIKLYFDSPSGAGLKHSEKAAEGTTVYRWEGSDIHPIIPEPEMPPVVELSPLIRVTTFGSWEELGKWWWALASPQMVVDKTIKQKVADLVKNKKTDDEKIAAIFDWVIRSTRYVGLEFGIHGFKPYRTTEIVSRGFGDCKDKATLLYVMLKEAGIDAAIALVRTRNSGIVNTSFPFQFLFDHAIAAVPSKNLYLDGTVDYLAYKTLPPADQGVFGLIVSEGKVEPRMTSILPPETNTQQVEIAMDIQGSGDAGIRGKVKASGIITSYYRSTYQTEGTRKERLESELSGIFPGVGVTSYSFSGLEDFGDNVEVSFEASVPGIAMVSKDEIQMTALPSYGLYKRYASRSKRKFAVVTDHLRVFVDHYLYKAAPGTVLSSIPKPVSIGSDKEGYSFDLDVKMIDPANLEIKATLKIGVFRIETDRYGAFREFCRKVDEATAQRIHMKKLAP